jgi:hypothetical protein
MIERYVCSEEVEEGGARHREDARDGSEEG